MAELRNYTRWAEVAHETYHADILGADVKIRANASTGLVVVGVPDRAITPDEARMIGVRLIEAAAMADAGRAIRRAPGAQRATDV